MREELLEFSIMKQQTNFYKTILVLTNAKFCFLNYNLLFTLLPLEQTQNYLLPFSPNT